MSDSKAIVAKLWNYCTILRDDGLSYGDYLEQLTYLPFLKMADEQHQSGFDRIVPEGFDWPSLLDHPGGLRVAMQWGVEQLDHWRWFSGLSTVRPELRTRVAHWNEDRGSSRQRSPTGTPTPASPRPS